MGSRHHAFKTLRAGASRALAGLLCGISLAVLPAAAGFAQAPEGDDEYSLKAAFLINFASFATWPDSHRPALHLCIYGDDPFGAHLDALEQRTVGTRPLQIRRTLRVDGLGGCDMVFITRSMIGNLNRVQDRIDGLPVLTIADSPGAMQRGVMHNIETLGNRIGFSVNLAAARNHGVGLSARLLKLASEIQQ